MFTVSERCKRMRDDAVNIKSNAPRICIQREFWYRYGLAQCAINYPLADNIVLNAAGTSSVMINSAVIINDDEIIVGYNYGDGLYAGLTNDNDKNHELLRMNGFNENQINWFFDPSVDIAKLDIMDNNVNLSCKTAEMCEELAICNSQGRQSTTCRHSVPDFELMLAIGYEGLLEKVNRFFSQNGDSDFYTALRMICNAGCIMGERWAKEADRIGRTDIADVCRQVPRYGARTFREAVQSIWFAQIVNTWEDLISANSLGRLDQILYPYYKHDIDAGIITPQEAFELICCLWIKLYRDYDVQQSCVGGTSPDGTSDINELSWMMLEATEQLDFIRCLSVRFCKDTDPAFIRKALHVVGHMQKGIPFFFNDDVMIPSLTEVGISYEDACDYTQLGCVETVIPGKSNPHAVNSRCNLLKALEYALNNGGSGINPAYAPGLKTGDPLSFDSYDKLYSAVKKQIAHLIHETVNIAVAYIPSSNHNYPKPVKSLLTEGCVESGRDFNDGGALYDYYQLMLVGIPNLVDSLAAIRTLVFEEEKYSLTALLDELANNWQNEAMRLDFVNKAPKYGNDITSVDSIAADIINYCCDLAKDESKRTGYSFHIQPFSYLWMIEHGQKCAASPDGRRKGEILAYSMSPMQGRDKDGLTALMNTISGLPTKRTPGTLSAIVEVDPKLFSDDNLPLLTELLLASAERGLSNVQFNTVNVETLIDAQLHPELHQNLAVRVSGFSQKFNLLRRDLQDHIIARTKHAQL